MPTYPRPEAIRVGVVGYGGAYNMGRAHLSEMRAAGMTPVAVAEIDPTRLAVARTDFPSIHTFDTLDAMLAEAAVDLVTVITPHDTHAPLGLRVLAAGRHCILEKPMAITTTECDTLIAAARDRDLLVSTYHNRHWDGWILHALEVAHAGTIGEIVRVDLRIGRHQLPGPTWRSHRRISGGILYDWGVHLLEYALQLLPGPVTEVSGYAHEGFWARQPGAPHPGNLIEDEAQLVARLADGRRINLTITSLEVSPKLGMMEVVGTRGSFLWLDWQSCQITEVRPSGEKVVTTVAHRPSEGHRFYENIAAHLTGRAPLVITPEWARRPIHLLDLASRSAREGRALATTYP
jgi:scyllo-inositol 2-dehydrogenase (NADP+)